MPRSLGDVVGDSIRRLREEKGWSQAVASQRLMRAGLPWTRSRLADLEIPARRRRDLTLGELILVAEAFGEPVTRLLAGGGSIELGKTERSERPLHVVRERLSGSLPPDLDLVGPKDIPELNTELQGAGPYWLRTSPKATVIYSDAEVTTARRLGVRVEWVRAQTKDPATEFTPELIEGLRERLREESS